MVPSVSLFDMKGLTIERGDDRVRPRKRASPTAGRLSEVMLRHKRCEKIAAHTGENLASCCLHKRSQTVHSGSCVGQRLGLVMIVAISSRSSAGSFQPGAISDEHQSTSASRAATASLWTLGNELKVAEILSRAALMAGTICCSYKSLIATSCSHTSPRIKRFECMCKFINRNWIWGCWQW